MVRKHTSLTTFLVKKLTKYSWYNGDMTKPFNKKLTQLADLFNDYHNPLLVPTRLEDNNPISLPPSKMANLTKPQDPQETINERIDGLQKLSHEPPLTKEKPDQMDDLPKPSLTKEKVEDIQMEELQQPSHVVEQQHRRGRGRPKGSKNKRTIEKLSQQAFAASYNRETQANSSIDAYDKHKQGGAYDKHKQGGAEDRETEKVSHNREVMLKKLSRNTPHSPLSVNLSMDKFISGKGKTSLSYTLLYASQLTPIQISLLLENADALELTMAEVLALSLLERTKNHDQKAEKIYWDLMKTQAKNEKITPIKQENTLLDEALSKAENAIFGEVIDNPEKV